MKLKGISICQIVLLQNQPTGATEMRINVIKFELVKMLLDVVLSENDDIDDKLGIKSAAQTTIPFKLAFNSLLNKKLINHY